ncbi:MAG: GNAT family N-acetyltransferase [Muribaculaceae bacterium]|nr:GNAT family N-acetyltransferase [Muribaculaceae bacterium]
MEEGRLKQEMESLWKETFGDSPAYVSLVFDNYFTPARVEYHEEDGELVAAMLGVPYEFRNGLGQTIKGLYLCGLATCREWRRKGIMSTLIESANRKAHEEGYDFTFLIPADEGMRQYYLDRGYTDSFYKISEHYVKGHVFDRKEVRIRLDRGVGNAELIGYLTGKQARETAEKSTFGMVHTQKDWEVVMQEFRLSGGDIIAGKENGDIKGVAFVEKDEREGLKIRQLIADTKETAQEILARIEGESRSNILWIRDLEDVVKEGEKQLWSPFYAVSNSRNAEYEDMAYVEEPYGSWRNAWPLGMVRLLDVRGLLDKLGWTTAETGQYSDAELQKLILRRPVGVGSQADALERILELPELTLTASLLLE